MSSTLLLIPIAAIAVYSVYRHLKKEMGGGEGGTCCDCPSQGKCGIDASGKKQIAEETDHC
ncbi:MAG: FeoB-associated Cys-rich membrane protein [bacterium]|nr:FeoB-associated Cys-rich membrane protein [bacterium]